MKNFIVRALRAWLLPVLLLLAAAHGRAETGEQAGPQLIITYRCAPMHRVGLQQELRNMAVGELHRLQAAGSLESYQVLFSRYVDAEGWDALVLLHFASDRDLGRWKSVERVRPAGLSASALAATNEVHTDIVEGVRRAGTPGASARSVFLVIPYKTLVSKTEYLKYADEYVLPQFNGWMDEGVLSQYAVYSSVYAAGRAWNAMIVLEYKDDGALGRRESVVAKVRERLAGDPAWKAVSENKKEVRVELHPVIADSL